MASPRPACLGCQQRERRIVQLEEEIQRLRQQLEQSQRDHGRQAHPFRRSEGTDKPKKPGRRKGHPADLRPVPTPDQIDRVIDVPLDECPLCHVPLFELGQVVQYQTDLPPIVPLVTQFNIETGTCPACRQRWQGRHPEQTSNAIGAAGNTLGPVVQQIENRLDDWLDANLRKRTRSPELNCLDDHIRAHRGEWLVFLHDAEVPPTNNHAEQMLRPAVITRKIGGCNKNLLGALVHSILSSIMVSCHRQGKRFLDLARQLWQSNQAQAIPLEALPDTQ